MEGYWSYETREKKNCLKSKISKLQVLLKSHMDPNKIAHLNIGCKDSTKLHNTNDYKEAKKLLENGADVNKKNGWGETPLHIALQGDKGFRFVKLLVEHGADVNAVSGLGRTPLHCIFKHGRSADKQIINLLLRYGAEIDVNSHAFYSCSINHLPASNDRWYDKGDIALTKSLIKITLLYGFSESYCKSVISIFCDRRSYCDEIRQFIKNCLRELRLMVQNVGGDLSLFHIAISEPEELKLVPVKFKKEYSTKFPVYYDIIKNSCKSYMRRVALFKVLENTRMVIVSETSNKEIVVNHDCLSMICEYLVNNDVDNFLKALFDVQTLNQRLKLVDIDL